MKYSELLTVAEQLRKCADIITNNDEMHEHPAVVASESNESIMNTVVTALITAETVINKAANDLEMLAVKSASDVSEEDIESIAAIANAYENSDDEDLKKQAAVLDQLLINFGQQDELRRAKKANEEEINRLREKYKNIANERSYKKVSEEQFKERKAEEATKAIQDQVKQRRPLEAPLKTRYSPDYPGVPMARIGDGIFQCAMTKKIYNFNEGYTTFSGEKVPGGTVANQTDMLGDRRLEQTNFSTREGVLGQG